MVILSYRHTTFNRDIRRKTRKQYSAEDGLPPISGPALKLEFGAG